LPIYEFQCKKCGEIFEGEFSIYDIILNISCPQCEELLTENEFERLISQSSFVLKFDTNY